MPPEEGVRMPRGAPTPRAAYPVHVLLQVGTKVPIEHVAEACDVEPTRRNVGRDEYAQSARAEARERRLALRLRKRRTDESHF